MSRTRRFLVLAEGNFGPLSSKTANACIRYVPKDVAVILDSAVAGRTSQDVLGFGGAIPIVSSFEEAMKFGPTALLIGIAAELALLLLFHRTSAAIEVIVFVIARKLIEPESTSVDVILGCAALAGLVIVRHYYLPGRAK